MLRETLPIMLRGIWRERDDAATVLEAHALLLAPRDPAAAAELLGAAEGLRRDVGGPVSAATAAVGVRAADICRASLGPAEHALRHDGGAAMHPDDLIGTLGRALATV